MTDYPYDDEALENDSLIRVHWHISRAYDIASKMIRDNDGDAPPELLKLFEHIKEALG